MESERAVPSSSSPPLETVWCHDCRASFGVPAAALDLDEPRCPQCAGPFIEICEEDVAAAAHAAATTTTAGDPRGGRDGIGTATANHAQEAGGGTAGGANANLHVQLGDDAQPDDVMRATRQILQHLTMGPTTLVDLSGPAQGQGGESQHAPAGGILGNMHVSISVGGLGGMNGLDMGDINFAELDTRTFHQPADPQAVAALPVVAMKAPESGESTQCPVCLTDIEIGAPCHRLPCGHHYHRECILEWLRTKNSCPVCRHLV